MKFIIKKIQILKDHFLKIKKRIQKGMKKMRNIRNSLLIKENILFLLNLDFVDKQEKTKNKQEQKELKKKLILLFDFLYFFSKIFILIKI